MSEKMQIKKIPDIPKVSVIIPCYNSGRTIRKCLEGVLCQDYPSFEVIVVDDRSTDGTADILRTTPGINVVFSETNHGPAHARNDAIKASTGDIVIMFDSDCVIEDRLVILKHVSAHTDPETHILGGGIKGVGQGVVARADNYSHWFLNIPYSANRAGTHLVTNNMSVKRGVFDKIGYFDVCLRTGEDTDFCERAVRAGYTLNLKTDIIVKHRDREGIREFLKCFYAVGFDRVPARRLGKHRYWFLLPFDLFSSLIYCLPLGIILTLQVVCAWFRYDKRVIFYTPLIFMGRLAMAIGIVRYYSYAGKTASRPIMYLL